MADSPRSSHVPARAATNQDDPASPATRSVVADFLLFLRQSWRWWLVPLLLMIGAILWLAWMTREPARPPTYPFF